MTDAKRTRRWKPRSASRATVQRLLYIVASLAAFAMAVGAGWKPLR